MIVNIRFVGAKSKRREILADLLRWCLLNGLRVIQPMTLMSHGLYNEPRGAYLPSISF